MPSGPGATVPCVRCRCLLLGSLLLGTVLLLCVLAGADTRSVAAERDQLALVDRATDRFVTWTIPGFTAYNNQLVIHVEMVLAAAKFGRKLISPDLGFEPILVNFTDLYQVTPAVQAVFGPHSVLDNAAAHEVQVVRADEMFAPSAARVLVVDDPDGLWAYVYKRWMFSLHTSPSTLWGVLDLMQVRPDHRVKRSAQSFAQAMQLQSRAVGMHLRGDEWRDRCEGVLKWDPRKQYYECFQQESHEIIAQVESVRPSGSDLVFLATNHPPDHPIILALRQHYGDKLLTWADVAKHIEPIAFWEQGLIEQELLVLCRAFIGNYFSTYTQVAALRRRMERSYFFKVRSDYVVWLLLILMTVALALMARILCRRCRALLMSRVKSS